MMSEIEDELTGKQKEWTDSTMQDLLSSPFKKGVCGDRFQPVSPSIYVSLLLSSDNLRRLDCIGQI